jgi:glyoxylase-like metal-dependent hydrolase (beta-lactamase superfamily II)
MLRFEIINMLPQFTNSILVTCGDDCIIFDPWGRADDWQKLLTDRNLNLRAVYATHGHPDHIACAPMLGVPWYMNFGDLDNMNGASRWLGIYGLPRFPDDYRQPENLHAGEIFPFAGDGAAVKMHVIALPGHSAGGVAFYFLSNCLTSQAGRVPAKPPHDCLTPLAGGVPAKPGRGVLLIGDTIFPDTIGRYDLHGGNYDELMKSISKIYNMNLPDDTLVISGHGPATTIGELKKTNPYFKS